jgi:hypothetical protein
MKPEDLHRTKVLTCVINNFFFHLFRIVIMSLSKPSFDIPKHEKKKVRTHEDARHVVCSSCHEKKGGCIQVTAITEALIKKFVFPAYDKNCSNYPDGLCNGCGVSLRKARSGRISATQQEKWDRLKVSPTIRWTD